VTKRFNECIYKRKQLAMASKIENTLNSALSSLTAFGSLSDTVEMVKKTWGQLGMPSSFAPTMDVEELDKRIADLQAVEQWLIANQTMLRGTIQGLEVQRNTIATVQALGKQVNQQFGVDFSNKTAGVGSSKTEQGSATSKKNTTATKGNTKSLDAAAQALNMPGLSTSAWWDLLQGQFNQIAQAAIASSNNAAVSGAKSFGAAATSAATKAATRVAKEVAGDMMKGAAKSVGKSIARKLSPSPKPAASKRKSK
jgi:hypothetical protein